MTAVPIPEAARLLGKPERTIRRWCANGKLDATRTADGWLVNLELSDNGQVADNGHANGHSVGQMATVPVSFLRELQERAESAAMWQGRATVLSEQLEQLQRALPAPAERPKDGPWWKFW